MITNNSHKVTNLDYLTELSKGNAEFVKDMIDIFLAENPEEIRLLEKGISEKDFDLIRSSSHKMKSTIPFVGLDKIIGDELSEIERAAITKSDLQKIETLFSKVKEMCYKAFEELKPG